MPPTSSTFNSDAGNSDAGERNALRPWLWTLAAVYGIEAAVWLLVAVTPPIASGHRIYLGGVYPTLTQALVHAQTERALALAHEPAVLFLGDSSTTFGIVPTRFTELTGLAAENLGLIQPLGVDGHVDLLESYLEGHAPPAALVYQFADGTLTQSDGDIADLGMLAGYRSWLGRDDSVARDWPSTRLRPIARSWIGGRWYQPYPNLDATREFMDAHRGYVRETRPWLYWRSQPAIAHHPDAHAGLERLIAVTAEHGILLLLVHAAMPEFYDAPASRALLTAAERELQTLAAPWPHVRVITPFAHYLPNDWFAGYHHLTVDGARLYTDQLAAVVRRVVAATSAPDPADPPAP